MSLDQFLAFTTLPNLHPAIVHFPIALLITAATLDLVSLFLRSFVWMDRAATTLYVLGTAGAGLAYLSGQQAARSVGGIPPEAAPQLIEHAELALYTLAAFACVTALRFLVTWLSRDDKRIQLGLFRLFALPAAFAAVALLAVTADHGGGLVYQHGVGVGLETPAPGMGEDQ